MGRANTRKTMAKAKMVTMVAKRSERMVIMVEKIKVSRMTSRAQLVVVQ